MDLIGKTNAWGWAAAFLAVVAFFALFLPAMPFSVFDRSVGLEDDSPAAEAGTAARDVEITASVNQGLAAHGILNALSIEVETVNGQVVLRGIAPDTAARNQAALLARGVAGVVGVNNELTVQPRSN